MNHRPLLTASTKLAAAALAATALAACASEPSPVVRAASISHPHAAEVWADKCGACHVPVEPGTRPRAVIEAAMARHQKRAKLSQDEWRELVEFLAASPDRTARNQQ
jgi:hypothetical protein